MITWLDGDRSGDRLDVYHNRHNRGDKTRLWSIKVPNGRVVGYADRLVVHDAGFVTRKTAIHRMWEGTGPRGTKKNVFAWVNGHVFDDDGDRGSVRVTFHPDEHDEFFMADAGPVRGDVGDAGSVWFDADGRCWI